MWRGLRQVLPTLLIVLSSYFLIKGIIALSPKNIAALSGTAWGYSLEIAQNLCHQRADTIIGFILLLSSIIAQLIVWCFHTGLDFGINRKGILLACLLIIILYIIANSVSNHLYNAYYHQVKSLLQSHK